MIVVMKLSATGSEIERVEQRLEEMGFKSHLIHGVERIVIGAVGEKKIAFPTGLELLPGVEKVVPDGSCRCFTGSSGGPAGLR